MFVETLRARAAARRRLLTLSLALSPFAVVACDSSTEPSDIIATVEVAAQGHTTLIVGNTIQLLAVARDAQDRLVENPAATWSSQNEQIAKVDQNGLVTAVGAGTVQITANVGGKTGQITITVVGVLAIQTSSLPGGAVSEPYSAQLVATGGVGGTIWTIEQGSLPPGLELERATGAISGTPTLAGDYSFTVSAESGEQTVTKSLTIQVAAGPLALLNWYLPAGYAGDPYSHSILASGGTGEYAFSVTAGALPDGLTLGADGVIQGVPSGDPGVYFFEVTVSSGSASASRAYSLAISNNPRSGFNVAIVNGYGVMPPQVLIDQFSAAVATLERAITSDFGEVVMPDARGDGVTFTAESCGVPDTVVQFRAGEVVEDLAIVVHLTPIDGPLGSFGYSVLCGVLDPNEPRRFATGFIVGDLSDLPILTALPEVTRAAVLHESIHVLGFDEFVWYAEDLIRGNGVASGPDGVDFAPCREMPRYVGAKGLAAYNALGGAEDYVPLQGSELPDEPDAVTSGCDRHWGEATFGPELMSSSASLPLPWPLSIVTLRALEDLWYTIDPDAAEPFVLPGTDEAAPAHVGADGLEFSFENDVVVGPALLPRPDGTVVEILPRGWGRR